MSLARYTRCLIQPRSALVLLLLAMCSAARAQLPPVPVPPQNPITEEKRILGKILFWDEQLSMTNTVSCGTCHTPSRGGADNRIGVNPGPDGFLPSPDDRRASPGVIRSDIAMDFLRDPTFGLNPQLTDRAANSNINSGYAQDLFWDGRARSEFRDPVTNQVVIPVGGALESQSVNPPVSGAEMAHDGVDWPAVSSKIAAARPLELASNIPPDVAAALADAPDYPELFQRAFGTPLVTARRIAFALATYQRTLIADRTPFDLNTMTQAQAQGFDAFQTSSCAVCHIPPLFTGNGFRNIGLRPPPEDLGRQIVTGNPGDRGRFKVPSLRNVGLKATFMHNGQFLTITDVIRFYARAPGAAPQFPDNRDPVMQQVQVPAQVAPLIQDFLTNALTDPRVRDQTFPFDRPTLTSERPDRRAVPQGGGVPGSGGTIARLIADMPGLLGTLDFRVGIDGPIPGTARLAYSYTSPTGPLIGPDGFLATIAPSPAGLATTHFFLSPKRFSNGQEVFLQWLIDDASAPGGQAASTIVRLPVFCGNSGCPARCAPDYNDDGFVDGLDSDRFNADFESGNMNADYNGDGFVDGLDSDQFNNDFAVGC